MINIWYNNIGAMDQEKFDLYLEELPVAWRKEIMRYHYFRDRALRLTGKLLLRKAILESGGSEDKWRTLEKDHNKKPFIKDWMPFNISHSGDIAVLAFGGNSPIGIDTEYIQEDADVKDLLSFFTESEKKIILESNNATAFYTIWVRKEAVLKAEGIGIINGLNGFESVPDIIHFNENIWHLKMLSIQENYVTCLSTAGSCDNISLRQMDL